MTIYEQEIEKVKNFDLKFLPDIVGVWLKPRPPIAASNRHVKKIANHILKEIEEVREVLAAPNAEHDEKLMRAAKKEAVDIVWLMMSLFITHGLTMDEAKVRSRVDGLGNRSDVWDMLSLLIGNLEDNSFLQADLEYILSVWLSAIAGLPGEYSLSAALVAVLEKDILNYPAELFPQYNPFNGQLLNEEQQSVSFNHPRRCLRLIRDFLRSGLGQHDREDGLRASDWQPFKSYILAFLDPKIKPGDVQVAADRAYQDLEFALIHSEAGKNLPSDYLTWTGDLGSYLERRKKLLLSQPQVALAV